MPTTRKRISRGRINGAGGELTGPALEDLLHGYSFFDEPFKNDRERRECWEKHRNFIMSLQGKPVQGEVFGLTNGVYFDFFTRPAAFWAYDSPGPRLFISCKNDFCSYFAQCPVAKNIPTEIPQCIICDGEDREGKSSFEGIYKIECVGHKFQIYEPQKESEIDFLQRHALLSEVELRHIEETKVTNNRP
ncbi:MAG: hypothetical protein ABSH06_00270 [Thermodesulfobacteriota bacterium]